jgi:hypothetical protein
VGTNFRHLAGARVGRFAALNRARASEFASTDLRMCNGRNHGLVLLIASLLSPTSVEKVVIPMSSMIPSPKLTPDLGPNKPRAQCNMLTVAARRQKRTCVALLVACSPQRWTAATLFVSGVRARIATGQEWARDNRE